MSVSKRQHVMVYVTPEGDDSWSYAMEAKKINQWHLVPLQGIRPFALAMAEQGKTAWISRGTCCPPMGVTAWWRQTRWVAPGVCLAECPTSRTYAAEIIAMIRLAQGDDEHSHPQVWNGGAR